MIDVRDANNNIVQVDNPTFAKQQETIDEIKLVARQATLDSLLNAINTLNTKIDTLQTELNQKLEPNQSVNVGNFPATQNVAGSVSVSNHPTQITGFNLETTQALIRQELESIDNRIATLDLNTDQIENYQQNMITAINELKAELQLKADLAETQPVNVQNQISGFALATKQDEMLAAFKAEDSAGVSGDIGIVILAQRRDSDSSGVDVDGDYATLKMDENGRLKVASQPANYPTLQGNIVANNGTFPFNVERISNVVLSVILAGVTNGAFTFEYSPNSTNGTDGNWFVVQVVRSNANTIETATGNLSATPTYGWEVSTNGYKWFRVRATGGTFGTATWIAQPAPFATEPIPAIGSHGISGTVTTTLSANQVITPVPQTGQGSSTAHVRLSTADTNLVSVKNGAGVINTMILSNLSASFKFFKLYNKASAPVIASDSALITKVIPMPPNTTLTITGGAFGDRQAMGIAYAITNAVGLTDTTAIGANEVTVSIQYT
jgi:hypothetical protein